MSTHIKSGINIVKADIYFLGEISNSLHYKVYVRPCRSKLYENELKLHELDKARYELQKLRYTDEVKKEEGIHVKKW